MLKVAILDDYKNVSQQFVDIEKLAGKYEIKIFSEPFEDEADALDKLSEFEALLIMRERTPITKNLIENLTKLKFIITRLKLDILLSLNFNKGDLIMIGGVITWGVFSPLLKKKKFTLPLLTLVHVICTFGLITVLPQFLYEYSNGELIKFDINLVYTLIFLALFPSIGSYYCWAGAVSIIGANRAGIFLSLIPLFSTIMAIFFYNEQFKFFHLIGAILIILGLFLSNKEIKNA